MQICLNTAAWHDRPLAEALAAAGEVRIDALELDVTLGSAHLDPTGGREAITALRTQLAGSTVAALAAEHPDLARLEDEGGEESVVYTVAAIKRAGDLGASVVTVTLGETVVDAWDTAWNRGLTALKMVLYQTAKSRVQVAVLLDIKDVLDSLRKAQRLLTAIDNPRLCLAVDTGYLHYRRIQLTEVLAIAGERLAHVRLCDADRTQPGLPIGDGEVNFPAAVKQLQAAGYAGALSIRLTAPERLGDAASAVRSLVPTSTEDAHAEA